MRLSQRDHDSILAADRHNEIMSSRKGALFSYAEVRPYAAAESLEELCGPAHGVLELPQELAWSGRRRFDLDDDYDRAAAYKILLEEGAAPLRIGRPAAIASPRAYRQSAGPRMTTPSTSKSRERPLCLLRPRGRHRYRPLSGSAMRFPPALDYRAG